MKKFIFSMMALVPACAAMGQVAFTGTVISSTGAVPFAAVSFPGTQLQTIATNDGTFQFTAAPLGRHVVVVHALGYRQLVDTIDLTANFTKTFSLSPSTGNLDEVVVNATRVTKANGMAFSNVSQEQIARQNLGQDAPFMLAQLPSVVVNSDAGNGIGYTGIRVRGSDPTRINITVNGVPVNDAESQAAFFVDMPDLVSSVNSIQVQRGVGTSANGAGAFGASVNFQTNALHEKPYAGIITSGGSFNTLRNTVSAGTGMLGKFTFDARASAIRSDGYIDRASSKLSSYYAAAGYYGKTSVIKLIQFAGSERTYQAWNYVPEDSIRSGNRTYNELGAYYDRQGRLQYYPGETDNYRQSNTQLHFITKLRPGLTLNLTGHYTKGRGYYEQYRPAESLSTYSVPDVVTPGGDTVGQTDLVRQLWLDNDFAGGIFNLDYRPSSALSVIVGGGYNSYFGRHFGELMWAQYASFTPGYRYYSNTANKNDGNIYVKVNYRVLPALNLFADVQQRAVSYHFPGLTDSLQERIEDKAYSFFNPKAGISWDISAKLNAYASVAVGHKEPGRDDFVQNPPYARPGPETLVDVEGGLQLESGKTRASVNFYNMQYRDQLALNGQVNAVGAPVRVNIPNSYRRGIELTAAYALYRLFDISGNLTLSTNKAIDFTEHIDSSYYSGADYLVYDKRVKHHNTDLPLSPSLISSMMITFHLVKGLDVSLIGKAVSRQYLDNTQDIGRSIAPYTVVDARLNYQVRLGTCTLGAMLGVYNLLSELYETNGYTYSYYYGGSLQTFNYKAPAAPVNLLGGVSLQF